ncbi:MAG TPA: hypothetical protein VMN58_11695 [Acidimicrobiales bacterium]|nr:hypothetical protein [Acidimicrobiales bacterium]
MGTDSLRFAATARLLAEAARTDGLAVPGFRSPPRHPGLDRSVRRRRGAPVAIAVRLAGRDHDDVVVDMVEGIVVANGLSGTRAAAARAALWAAVATAAPPTSREATRRAA